MRKWMFVILSLIFSTIVLAFNETDFWQAKTQFDSIIQAINKEYPKVKGDQGSKQWKADLNQDKVEETIIVNFSFFRSSLSYTLKVYYPKLGCIFHQEFPQTFSGFVFCDLDPDFAGKEIIVWFLDEEAIAPLKFILNTSVQIYVWTGQQYLASFEYSAFNQFNPHSSAYPKNLLSAFLVNWAEQLSMFQRASGLRSKTIQEAISRYQQNVLLDTDSSSHTNWRIKYTVPQITDNWASISRYYVDNRGEVVSEAETYLLKKDEKGWYAIYVTDESVITTPDAIRFGIPQKVLKKIGWQTIDY